jgi:hypothetical protein
MGDRFLPSEIKRRALVPKVSDEAASRDLTLP